MYLTITSTAPNATDLGFLLHKHPDRAQQFDVGVGTAHVFYPEAAPDRCTAALLLEIDPIGLVRGKRFGGDAFSLAQYVNDRPYAASSMLAVALGRVFRSALAGRCAPRPELPGAPLPLQIRVPAVPSSGGADLVHRLFAPLGWQVGTAVEPLDPAIPAWGDSRYIHLQLTGVITVADALSHLYVLLPVLDDAKHYWVGDDEIDKLVRVGGGWLAGHPERDLITRRYLRHRGTLVGTAIGRLAEVDDSPDAALDNAVPQDPAHDGDQPAAPGPPRLADLRQRAVLDRLTAAGARRVVDLGCGDGALLVHLLADASFIEIVGADVSPRALAGAERRLGLDRLPERQRDRLRLLQTSLTYRDDRLAGFDAVVLMEVVEHLDPPQLPRLAAGVFDVARPATVVMTTPNADYNVRYPGLLPGGLRHRDHRFEWTRDEFAAWSADVADRYGYTVAHHSVGDVDPVVGPPTQLAVFTRVAP